MVSVFHQDTCKLVESGVCSYHSMEANWRDLSKAISLKQHTVSTHTENINAVIESAITGFIWSHFVLNKNGLIYIRLLSVSTIQPLGSLCPHWNSWQKKSKGCKRRAHRLSFGPDNSTHAHFRVLWNENDRFACHKPADDGDRWFKIVTFKCAILENVLQAGSADSLFKDLSIYCLDTHAEKSLILRWEHTCFGILAQQFDSAE